MLRGNRCSGRGDDPHEGSRGDVEATGVIRLPFRSVAIEAEDARYGLRLEQMAAIAILRRNGWTVARIARVLRCGVATVDRRLAVIRSIETEGSDAEAA